MTELEGMGTKYRFCLSCGCPTDRQASFCGECGNPLVMRSAQLVTPPNSEPYSITVPEKDDPQPSDGDRPRAATAQTPTGKRQPKSRMSTKSRRNLIRIWLGTVVGLLVLAVITDRAGPHSTSSVYVVNVAARDEAAAALALLLIPIFVMVCVWTWKLGGWAMSEALVAGQPIPTPQEISVQLETEWGRPATVQEVAAVHQMLATRKTEALINAGVGLGSIYLVEHRLQGKK
jgi:hypothetical protein